MTIISVLLVGFIGTEFKLLVLECGRATTAMARTQLCRAMMLLLRELCLQCLIWGDGRQTGHLGRRLHAHEPGAPTAGFCGGRRARGQKARRIELRTRIMKIVLGNASIQGACLDHFWVSRIQLSVQKVIYVQNTCYELSRKVRTAFHQEPRYYH